ncbi:MAG: 1,4-beta-xylanase [Phycisphaera sp.]|nr:1,4-beta-xylanase [Phycisphaera sp.]
MSRWTAEQANVWYANQPWLVGCNFIPSTAINQLEMWQADTFDAATIDRELGWMASIGMNTARVYLHDLAWEADREGFKKRIDTFLGLTIKHGIRPTLVIFDDCWKGDAKIGKQPDPIPSVHNSGWLRSPSRAVHDDPSQWSRLEKYVKDIVGSFARDGRVLFWDLYNEPGNSGYKQTSLPLLKLSYEWARAVGPTQPITAGVWIIVPAAEPAGADGNMVTTGAASGMNPINDLLLAESDIITFHCYHNPEKLQARITELKALGRPMICTEWLARGHGSEVATCLPIFHREHVGCMNWGFVSGKTQTVFAWGTKPDAPEPKRWHHDLLKPDGSPHDTDEAALFRKLTGRGRPVAV